MRFNIIFARCVSKDVVGTYWSTKFVEANFSLADNSGLICTRRKLSDLGLAGVVEDGLGSIKVLHGALYKATSPFNWLEAEVCQIKINIIDFGGASFYVILEVIEHIEVRFLK